MMYVELFQANRSILRGFVGLAVHAAQGLHLPVELVQLNERPHQPHNNTTYVLYIHNYNTTPLSHYINTITHHHNNIKHTTTPPSILNNNTHTTTHY
jgi:hypothetical protein